MCLAAKDIYVQLSTSSFDNFTSLKENNGSKYWINVKVTIAGPLREKLRKRKDKQS